MFGSRSRAGPPQRPTRPCVSQLWCCCSVAAYDVASCFWIYARLVQASSFLLLFLLLSLLFSFFKCRICASRALISSLCFSGFVLLRTLAPLWFCEYPGSACATSPSNGPLCWLSWLAMHKQLHKQCRPPQLDALSGSLLAGVWARGRNSHCIYGTFTEHVLFLALGESTEAPVHSGVKVLELARAPAGDRHGDRTIIYGQHRPPPDNTPARSCPRWGVLAVRLAAPITHGHYQQYNPLGEVTA